MWIPSLPSMKLYKIKRNVWTSITLSIRWFVSISWHQTKNTVKPLKCLNKSNPVLQMDHRLNEEMFISTTRDLTRKVRPVNICATLDLGLIVGIRSLYQQLFGLWLWIVSKAKYNNFCHICLKSSGSLKCNFANPGSADFCGWEDAFPRKLQVNSNQVFNFLPAVWLWALIFNTWHKESDVKLLELYLLQFRAVPHRLTLWQIYLNDQIMKIFFPPWKHFLMMDLHFLFFFLQNGQGRKNC